MGLLETIWAGFIALVQSGTKLVYVGLAGLGSMILVNFGTGDISLTAIVSGLVNNDPVVMLVFKGFAVLIVHQLGLALVNWAGGQVSEPHATAVESGKPTAVNAWLGPQIKV